MIIRPGHYIGSGYFYLENEGSRFNIGCTLIIDTRGQQCKITGHWETYSRNKKNSLCILIDKVTQSDVKAAKIELSKFSMNGKLFSLDSIVNGIFSTEYRTEILGVTLFESQKGMNVAGTLQGEKNSHFRVELLSADPERNGSNVVALSDHA